MSNHETDQPSIVTQTVEHVRIISLNRPHRHNALDDDALERLNHAFKEAVADSEVRAILVRGEGRSFCSGRDLGQLGSRAKGESDFDFVRAHQVERLAMLECVKPVVAAIKGAALGGGCELALCADIRVSGPDLKLGLPEIHYGLLPDTGGTMMLANLAGLSRAKYMVLTGERIGAETALAWGLVDFVVDADQLDARALEIAVSMAAKPPLALAIGKQIISHNYHREVRAALEQELLAQTTLFASDDYREARAARAEGRAPEYKGR